MKYLLITFLLLQSLAFGQSEPVTRTKGVSDTGYRISPNIQLPNSQVTKINSTTTLLETGNNNLLPNPGFESGGLIPWTCSGALIESTNPISGKYSGSLDSTGDLCTSMAITIPSGLVGKTLEYSFDVTGTSVSIFEICASSGTPTQTCKSFVTTPNKLIKAKMLYTPTSATNNKIEIKRSATLGVVVFDNAYMGIPRVDIENVRYTASINTRDSIPASERKVGLIVGVRSNNKFYMLSDSDLTNTGWIQMDKDVVNTDVIAQFVGGDLLSDWGTHNGGAISKDSVTPLTSTITYIVDIGSGVDAVVQTKKIPVGTAQRGVPVAITGTYSFAGETGGVTAILLDDIDVEIPGARYFLPKTSSGSSMFKFTTIIPNTSPTVRVAFYNENATLNGGNPLRVADIVVTTATNSFMNVTQSGIPESCGLVAGDFVGFGTVSNINLNCKREGSKLLITGTFTSTGSTATIARLNLKYKGTILTANPTAYPAAVPHSSAGAYYRYGTVINNGGPILILGNNTFINFSDPDVFGPASNSSLVPANGNDIAAGGGETLNINASIEIAEWQQTLNVATSKCLEGPVKCANSFTFESSNTGVVSALDVPGWISNGSITSTGTYEFPLGDIGITQKLNCIPTAASSTRIAMYRKDLSTLTKVVFNIATPSVLTNDSPFVVECKKVAPDNTNHDNIKVAPLMDIRSTEFLTGGFDYISGKPIYRRCHIPPANITVNATVITTWSANLNPINFYAPNTSGNYYLALFAVGANESSVRYVKSTGQLLSSLGGSYLISAGTPICMNYTK